MGKKTSSDRAAPQEDLGRLIDLERDLATRLESARRESTNTIERAKTEAGQTAERIRETETARRLAIDEKVAAYRRDQLAGVEAEGRKRAEYFGSFGEDRVRALGLWIVRRLVGRAPGAGSPA